jgi:sec-independent protein translocase protein TatB
VFGLSFGELVVLLIVAVVVLGPKELPGYLRKAGQFASRMRRLAYDMREKSGIDEVLRSEGIDLDIAEIRRLARGEIAGMNTALRSTVDAIRPGIPRPQVGGAPRPATDGPQPAAPAVEPAVPYVQPSKMPVVQVEREREYPCEGADSYGALPDTAVGYEGSLPASPLADDALYARGEAA